MTADAGRTGPVLVGVDGSEGAAAALRWAIAYASAVDAEVVAVHAFETPAYVASYPLGEPVPLVVDESMRERVKEAFEQRWCAPLAAAGVRSRTVFQDGRAAPALLDIAEREKASLIVTGRRGLGTLGELVLGSVSHRLVHHAHCPVVLVPAGTSSTRGPQPQ